MPSVKRSTKWFIRVDYPRSALQEKVNKILSWIDLEKALGVFHVGKSGENPHFHMILTLKSELQKQSLDVRFKTLFEVKGSQYSSKVWDGAAGAGSYLFHENTDDIVVNRGYLKADIEEFKRLNQEVQKVVELNKERGTSKSIQRIIDALPDNPDRKQIFYKIMDEIREGNMYHPGFRLSAIVDEIFIKKCSDANWQDEKWLAWTVIAQKNSW